MTEAGRAALERRIAAAEDPAATEPPPVVTEAIDAYHRLVGIPVEHLVPDPALLPEESIRFFVLDQDWLDALIRGVLSVGGTGSRERAFAARNFDAVRERIRSAAVADTGPVAGMLLRSTLVARWPTLHVAAFATPSDSGGRPMEPLRLETVAPTLLLALWPQVPVEVWIEEPPRELVLGFDGDPCDGLTVPSVIPGGRPIPVYTRDPARRVIDIARLMISVARQPGQVTGPGSAPVAAALLRPPYRLCLR